MLTAADVMTRDLVTVKKETSVRDLAAMFTDRGISSIPVVDDAGKLIGIVTETDLVEQDRTLHIPTVVSIFDWVIYLESDRKFEKELQKMTGGTVVDIYTEEVAAVSPSTPLNEVADLIIDRRIHSVPVVENGKLVGIVARVDLIRSMMS